MTAQQCLFFSAADRRGYRRPYCAAQHVAIIIGAVPGGDGDEQVARY
ncbi:hypothetical protein [Pontixanthobacter sp.]